MNNIFYTKTQDYKLFGKTIFQKVTVYNETEHDTDFDIVVKPDYFESEFNLEENKNNGKHK